MIYFIITIWVVCGIVAVGIIVANTSSDGQDSYREDLAFGMLVGIFGPVGLLVSFLLSGFAKDGWRIRRKKII